jgi:hypothetical protein
MVEDAIGLLILFIIAGVLVVLAGLSVLLSLDLLSSAASWIVRGPAFGWTLLGALFGTLFGVVQGMRTRGKSDDLRKIYFGAAVVAALLAPAGAASPAGRLLLGW